MIIVIDGPEKAGKTTTIAEIEKIHPAVRVRRWGPVDSWAQYASPLRQDLCLEGLVIWDRSWAAEVCYDDLLDRGRDIDEHAIRAELEEPLLAAGGMMVMVLAPENDLAKRRTRWARRGGKPDLPCDPRREYERFERYAHDHRWATVTTGRTRPASVAKAILLVAESRDWE